MVYKKYIKRGGKLYGPYLYESKRVNGRVVTNYVGYGGKKRQSALSLTLSILFLFSFIAFVYLTNNPSFLKSKFGLSGYAVTEIGGFDSGASLSEWNEIESDADGDFLDYSPDGVIYYSGNSSLLGKTSLGSGIEWAGEYVSKNTPSMGPGAEAWLDFVWRKAYAEAESEKNEMYILLERPDGQTRELWRNNAKTWDSWNVESVNISSKLNQNGIYKIRLYCDLKNSNSSINPGSLGSMCWYDGVKVDLRGDLYGYYPEFSGFSSSPVSSSAYSYNTTYEFIVKIEKTNGTVGLKFGEENKFLSKSYPAQKINGSQNDYIVYLSGLSAGNYNYYWWTYSNGSGKNYAASNTSKYKIVVSPGEINNYIDGERKNKAVLKGSSVNIAVKVPFYQGEGVRQLYLDGKLYQSMSQDFESNIVFNDLKVHNISAYFQGNNNHTSDWEDWTLAVVDSASNISLFGESPLIAIDSPKEQQYIPETKSLDFSVSSNVDLGNCVYWFDSEIANFGGVGLELPAEPILNYHFNREFVLGETENVIIDFGKKGIPAISGNSASYVPYGRISGAWSFNPKAVLFGNVLSSSALQNLEGGGFSVLLWAFLRDRNSSGGKQNIIETIDSSPSQGFLIRYESNAGVDRIYYGAGKEYFSYQSTEALQGKWTHIAIVYSNSSNSVKLYLNGKQVQENSLNEKAVLISSQIAIGGKSRLEGFDGLVDEVSVFGTSLTPNDLNNIYVSQNPKQMTVSSDLKRAFVANVSLGNPRNHQIWITCRDAGGQIIHAPMKRSFTVASSIAEDSEDDEINNSNTGCSSEWKCSEWSDCSAIFGNNFGEIIENNLSVHGERMRVCYDFNKCNDAFIEKVECDLRVPISLERKTWCGEEYVEVFDISDSQKELVSRIKEELLGQRKKINIGFVVNSFGDYCDHCYNNKQDYDEQSIDCGGKDCGQCSLFLSGSNSLNVIKAIALVLLLSFIITISLHFLLEKISTSKEIGKYKEKMNYYDEQKKKLIQGAALVVAKSKMNGSSDREISETLYREGFSDSDIKEIFRIASSMN